MLFENQITGATLNGGLEIIAKVRMGRNPQILAETQQILNVKPETETLTPKQIELRNSGDAMRAKLNEKLNLSEVKNQTNITSIKLSNEIEIKNARFGTIEEKQIAKSIVKRHREKVSDSEMGNYGYLEGNLGEIKFNRKITRSGAIDDSPQVFEALNVNSKQQVNSEGGWIRTTDSEYKMLNDLANRFGAKKGEVYTDVKGEIKIVSERKFCPSCKFVIQQFRQMFPKVKLILVENINSKR